MSEPRVRLRDVTLADADLLDAWNTPEGQGEFNDFEMPRSPAPREALAAGPLRDEYNGQLIVELVADATPIGTVSWHRVMNGPNPDVKAFAWFVHDETSWTRTGVPSTCSTRSMRRRVDRSSST